MTHQDDLERSRELIEAEVDVLAAEIYAEATAAAQAIAVEPLDEGPDQSRDMITRRDFVPRAEEAQFCRRDAAGRIELRLVDAGDRLVLWSPRSGGALLNPKGRGIIGLGLVSSYVRSPRFYPDAYRWADLRPWRRVLLRRERQNPHDPNAIAVLSTRREVIGYVQAGKVRPIARRMDAGEKFAAISMRGPGPGDDTDTTVIIIGELGDVTALLDASSFAGA